MSEDINKINKKLEELENKLIEQEHRPLNSLLNFTKYYNQGGQKRLAALKSLLWIFIFPGAIALGGGIFAYLSYYELTRQTSEAIKQNEKFEEQNIKFGQQNIKLDTQNSIIKLQNKFFRDQIILQDSQIKEQRNSFQKQFNLQKTQINTQKIENIIQKNAEIIKLLYARSGQYHQTLKAKLVKEYIANERIIINDDFEIIRLWDLDLTYLEFKNDTFRAIDFTKSDFQHTTFINCVFKNCIMKDVDFTNTSMDGNSFINSNLNGCKINRCLIINPKQFDNFANTIGDPSNPISPELFSTRDFSKEYKAAYYKYRTVIAMYFNQSLAMGPDDYIEFSNLEFDSIINSTVKKKIRIYTYIFDYKLYKFTPYKYEFTLTFRSGNWYINDKLIGTGWKLNLIYELSTQKLYGEIPYLPAAFSSHIDTKKYSPSLSVNSTYRYSDRVYSKKTIIKTLRATPVQELHELDYLKKRLN